MPTVRTVTVKPSGGDYTSLASAIAGECPSGTDLVSLDRQLNIECHAMLDLNNRVVLSGVTTDATRYIRIYAAQSHGGKWSTSAYRYEITTGFGGWFVAFLVDADYTRIEGLQLTMTPDTNSRHMIGMFSAEFAGQRYTGNLIRVVNGSTSDHAGIVAYQDGFVYIANNIVYQTGTPSGDGIAISAGTFNGGAYVYNNTVYGWGNGMIRYTGNAIIAKNNLVQGCTTCYGSTYDAASTHNLSEDTSSPNAAYRSLSVAFVDEAGFDFHLDPSDTAAKDAGADLSADAAFPFSTDIDGDTRSGSWDIGADEAAAATGSTGSGTLTSGSSSISCSGKTGRTGSATVSSGSCSISSAGKTGRSGSSTLASGNSSVTGTGTLAPTGSGSLVSGSSSTTGAGKTSRTGSGTLNSGSSSISSSGLTSRVGSGTLQSGNSSTAGTGVKDRIGSGVLVSGDSSISSAGTTSRLGTGSLLSGASSTSGSGKRSSVGSGSAISGSSSISAQGKRSSVGSGTPASARSTVSGTGRVVIVGTGSLISGHSSVSSSASNIEARLYKLTFSDTVIIKGFTEATEITKGIAEAATITKGIAYGE